MLQGQASTDVEALRMARFRLFCIRSSSSPCQHLKFLHVVFAERASLPKHSINNERVPSRAGQPKLSKFGARFTPPGPGEGVYTY